MEQEDEFSPSEIRKWFTPLMNEIAGEIGVDAAIGIFRTYRGRVLKVPICAKSGQKLTKLIGLDAATKLSDRWGAEELNIPHGPFGSKRRFFRACDMFEKGLPRSEIAHTLGVARSTVFVWQRQWKDAGGVAGERRS